MLGYHDSVASRTATDLVHPDREELVFARVMGALSDPVRLAETIYSALALSGTPFTTPAAGAAPSTDLDTAQLESILGYRGNAAGSVYQFSIPRTEQIVESGMEVPPSMGRCSERKAWARTSSHSRF